MTARFWRGLTVGLGLAAPFWATFALTIWKLS